MLLHAHTGKWWLAFWFDSKNGFSVDIVIRGESPSIIPVKIVSFSDNISQSKVESIKHKIKRLIIEILNEEIECHEDDFSLRYVKRVLRDILSELHATAAIS